MTAWSLSQLLAGLHERIEQELALARKSFGHSGTKGDASQDVWLQLLSHYLPERYRAASAHIVDSKGAFSDQIDVVVYDRQYSPIIFKMGEQIILPAESVYAVFEAKQAINLEQVRYATSKVGLSYAPPVREARKRKDTTSRECSLAFQEGQNAHCSTSVVGFNCTTPAASFY